MRKVALAQCYIHLLHSRQRAWFSFPQTLRGECDGDSSPWNPSVQTWRGVKGSRLHFLHCVKLHGASYCWPSVCYLSPKLGKLHRDTFQDQGLAEILLLEKFQVSALLDSPQGQLFFPHSLHLYHHFSFFFRGGWGEGAGDISLFSFIFSPHPPTWMPPKLRRARTHEHSYPLFKHKQCQPAHHSF